MTAFMWGIIAIVALLLLAVADAVVGISESESDNRDMADAVLDYEHRREGLNRW